MATSLDHCYSVHSSKRRRPNEVTNNNGEAKRKGWQSCLGDSPVSSLSEGDCGASPMSSCPCPPFLPDDRRQETNPLALLFPDCILCLWSANVYSHAIVADLHTRAVEYAGDDRPHAAVYSACFDGWHACHRVAELAPSLTKDACVAHFASNILCRFNRQRCQPALLYCRKTVSRLVDTFPASSDAVTLVSEQGTSAIYWCQNAFFCFLAVQLAKLSNLIIPEKRRRLVYAVLQRHTDFFISQWLMD
jgi:hypothetical protein